MSKPATTSIITHQSLGPVWNVNGSGTTAAICFAPLAAVGDDGDEVLLQLSWSCCCSPSERLLQSLLLLLEGGIQR